MDRLPDKTMTPGTHLENHGRFLLLYVAQKHVPLYANFPFVNGRCPFFTNARISDTKTNWGTYDPSLKLTYLAVSLMTNPTGRTVIGFK